MGLNITSWDTEYSTECKKMIKSIIDEKITCDLVQRRVRMAFENVNDAFWHEAASSTGKYHPLYACGDAGLARHTIAAAHFGERNCLAYNVDDLSRSVILAALLLHDTCKRGVNFEEKYTVFEHPILVWKLLPDEINGSTWRVICQLIASHMGKWNKPSEQDMKYGAERIIKNFEDYRGARYNNNMEFTYLPMPETPEAIIVAMSDFTASDKDCMLTLFESQKGAWKGIR